MGELARGRMRVIRVKMGSEGRITIPARMRKVLQMETGDAVVLQLEAGTIRVIPQDLAIRMAQEVVRRYVPEGFSLVDSLLSERRGEAF
jgi:AbrB family looped-hinge helix DNA binding protein